MRIRRKKIQKENKLKRWRRTLAATEEYQKLHDNWVAKKRSAAHEAKLAERKASKVVKAEEPKKEVKKVPAEKQKRVELPPKEKGTTGGATVVASITKVKKVVKRK